MQSRREIFKEAEGAEGDLAIRWRTIEADRFEFALVFGVRLMEIALRLLRRVGQRVPVPPLAL
jgi:hypothetical protein